jgi:hypothetical protein
MTIYERDGAAVTFLQFLMQRMKGTAKCSLAGTHFFGRTPMQGLGITHKNRIGLHDAAVTGAGKLTERSVIGES